MVDELNNTSTMESNTWYVNHRPTAGTISLNVTSDETYNYYTCELSGITDIDGDNITGFNVYYFYNSEGSLLQSGSGVNTFIVNEGAGANEQAVECRAQAYDGRLYSAYLADDDHPRIQSLVLDTEVVINQLTTIKVSVYNTSALSANPLLDYITSLNVLSDNNVMVFNEEDNYYELSFYPNSVGDWTIDKISFQQTNGESFTLFGDSNDYFTVTTSDSGTSGGGGSSGGEEPAPVTIINQTVIGFEGCGDGVCDPELGENPFSCSEDCRINYDEYLKCIWDDDVDCHYGENWFIILMIIIVVVGVLVFLYFTEERN